MIYPLGWRVTFADCRRTAAPRRRENNKRLTLEHPGLDAKSIPYNLIDFEGGLYAAAISRDGEDTDGERVVNQIKEWVISTKYFQLDESAERPLLFHVTTSDLAFEKMKYRQLDLYVPIK